MRPQFLKNVEDPPSLNPNSAFCYALFKLFKITKSNFNCTNWVTELQKWCQKSDIVDRM